MAQPPPPGFATRAMPPVRNPVYRYDVSDEFRQASPVSRNVLEDPPLPKGGDPRLTAAGSTPPVAGLTPIVPFAYQTPHNVWALYPA